METGVSIIEQSSSSFTPAEITPEQTIEKASRLATAIASVIEKQKLYTSIQGKRYVRVDAYVALGNIQGVFPRETKVIEHDDGTYEAFVELIEKSSGQVIGGASAICGTDEPTWKARPKFARRSMATTRAVGKAFRIHHAWILALAGYETTPSEEMDHVQTPPPPPADDIFTGSEEQTKKLTDHLKNMKLDDEKVSAIIFGMKGKKRSQLESVMKSVLS
jgi:hypothetical protein